MTSARCDHVGHVSIRPEANSWMQAAENPELVSCRPPMGNCLSNPTSLQPIVTPLGASDAPNGPGRDS